MNYLKRGSFLLLLISLQVSGQQHYDTTWQSIDSRPIPAWFTDAKFGIFIHWGVYSVPAWGPVGNEYPVYSKYAEWYWYRLTKDSSKTGDAFRNFHVKTYGPNFRYQDFVNSFRAELFNPAQWADLFAASGAKYVVLTSKHHEGFTLWPSKESWNWNAVDVGPHRDLAGDLIKAVKAKGLKMGFYYSMYEWFNPLYHTDVNKYVDQHMMPQLKDLVLRYQPDIVWPDGEWEHPSTTWKSTQFLSWLYNESPVKKNVVVNDRWGSETRGKHGGYYTTEYDLVGDQDVKGKKISHPWEECRGIGFSFGYNRNESLEDYQSSESLVHTLIEKVSKGGNLLLDIGPASDGTIPVIMQQRLVDIGQWLQVNGEAIYGTREWENAPAAKKNGTLYFTRKGNDLYAIVTKFPATSFIVDHVNKTSAITLLGSRAKVKWNASNGKLAIEPPVITPGENKISYAWVFKISGAL
jgi:alpha-L-fucosidase